MTQCYCIVGNFSTGKSFDYFVSSMTFFPSKYFPTENYMKYGNPSTNTSACLFFATILPNLHNPTCLSFSSLLLRKQIQQMQGSEFNRENRKMSPP